MTTEDKNKRHENRMAKKKAVIDEKIKKADKEQGVIVITTGNGKGKSSSGFGMVARALGHGMKVGIVQFIKGATSTAEETFFRLTGYFEEPVPGENIYQRVVPLGFIIYRRKDGLIHI